MLSHSYHNIYYYRYLNIQNTHPCECAYLVFAVFTKACCLRLFANSLWRITGTMKHVITNVLHTCVDTMAQIVTGFIVQQQSAISAWNFSQNIKVLTKLPRFIDISHYCQSEGILNMTTW